MLTCFLLFFYLFWKGTSRDNLERLLEHTGYKRPTESNPVDYGKWFSCDGKNVPCFLSLTSYQRNIEIGDDKGWTIAAKIYPDKWILPEDSFVLTVNASEIIRSCEYSAGVTLRFPRISALRLDKACEEVETLNVLRQIFFSKESSSTKSNASIEITASRFLTPAQKQKSKRKVRKKNIIEVKVPEVEIESHALKGLSFAVLEGVYNGNNLTICTDTKNKKYISQIQAIKCRNNIISFIRRHGGIYVISGNKETSFIVGGKRSDSRVKLYTKTACSVVHWSFVMNMVFQWLDIVEKVKLEDGDSISCSIKDSFQYLTQPKRYDYLVISPETEVVLGEKEVYEAIEYRTLQAQLQNIRRKRSMLGHEFSKLNNGEFLDSISFLSESELWVLGGKRQKFWPYQPKHDASGNIVGWYHSPTIPTFELVFVDSDYSSEIDCEIMQSVVPLLEAMGATIAKLFHSKITHILTKSLHTHDIITLAQFLSGTATLDSEQALQERGQKWISRIQSFKEIILITPT